MIKRPNFYSVTRVIRPPAPRLGDKGHLSGRLAYQISRPVMHRCLWRNGSNPSGRTGASVRAAFLVGFSTLSAPAVNDDPRAGSVGAENPIFKIKATFIFTDGRFTLSLQLSAAHHAETALARKRGPALRAFLSPYFVMAVWTFHFENQLFLEVVT